MPMYRVHIVWTGQPANGDGLSTFYFDENAGTAAQAAAAVGTLINEIDSFVSPELNMYIPSEVAIIDPANGDILDVELVSDGDVDGIDSGTPLPFVSQGLVQLRTGVYNASREMRGRLFIPGVTTNRLSDGAPSSAYRTGLQAAFDNLRTDANSDWVVWSRTRGLFASVTSNPVWNKFAELRSRRD